MQQSNFKEVTTKDELTKMLKLTKEKILVVFYLKGEWFDE